MPDTENHNSIMEKLGELKNTVEGTNKRLDTLNGSVAKHELRLATQDVLNAQITMTQSQVVNDQREMKAQDKVNNDFILRTQGSIQTFKWLFGFVGLGTLVNVIIALSKYF